MLHLPGPRRRVSRIILLGAFHSAALIGAPRAALQAATPVQDRSAMLAQPVTVTVPPVKGLPADSADSVLKRRGLRSVRVTRRVIVGIAGNVLDQSPAAGRSAKRGDFDTIYVAVLIPTAAVSGRVIGTVATGAPGAGGAIIVPMVPVPPLGGLLPTAAETVLRAHRLVLKGVESRPSDASNNGRVIDQSIRADSHVAVGTGISVIIGSYAPPRVDSVPVPQLVNQTLAAARARVRALGLRLQVTSTTSTPDSAYRDSIVLTQDPRYPRRVAPNWIINISIVAFSQALSDSVRVAHSTTPAITPNNTTGRGRAPPPKPMVTVPVLTHMTLGEARVRAGDSLHVVADGDTAANANVTNQNLATLSLVPFGTSVRLRVEPAPNYWKWILIAVGLAVLGGIALGKWIRRDPVPLPPPPPPPPPPVPAITTAVSGDSPHVRLRSTHHDLRGPEIELHSLPAVMTCDIAVEGSSLTLEDDIDAHR